MVSSPRTIFIHVFGCAAFLMLPVLFAPGPFSFHSFANPRTQQEFTSYIMMLIFFYINYYYLIPKFYTPGQYFPYILCMLAYLVVLCILPKVLIVDRPPPHEHFRGGHRPFIDLFELSHTVSLYLIIVFFSQLLRINNQLKLARQEKLNAELLYLKAQINPHFLFNTLNSIYSLALTKSDDTASAIVKLSGMMRYVITESQHHFVSLDKEISYISDYIELQKFRLVDWVKLSYTITGDTAGKQIAPLLLIPFIENAFKYGVNAEEDSVITINILIGEQSLTLEVRNNKVQINAEAHESSGLGLENTKGRLELLYPQKHDLFIRDEKHLFFVSLKIDLQ
jgi:hypothetical protein